MNLIAFLSYVIITSITPGPSNILMMNEARRFGFKGSIRFQIGIISGFIILGVVTSLLTTSLYHWIPMIEPYFKIVGAAYLLYLAWQIAFSTKSNNDAAHSKSSFLSGLLFQVLNIKSILYFLTTMSTFILPYHDSNIAALSLMSATILIGCAALLLWSIFGATFKKIFLKYDKLVNTIMCLLLVYSAIAIL
ncbi:LysE family transporter [Ectobacillus funiculus]|uniref:LysE family transporter n=1 Tax=Ectobacillus funiculus TaxID=137993 RepID=A0ABV5WGX1_9BACI